MNPTAKWAYAKLKAGPFPTRMGTTVGNAVRRTLLSAIEGHAVTAVRIRGISHEFAMIPGIKEDGVDLIANLRKLRVKSLWSEATWLELRAQTGGIVRAGAIRPKQGIEILNPELPLATLEEGAELAMDMEVSRGVGWRPAEANRRPDHPSGVLPVESDFSPVGRVAYAVEKEDEGENVLWEVWTDRSISPEEAVTASVTKLSKVLQESLVSAEYDDREGTFILHLPGMAITLGAALEDVLFEMAPVLDAQVEIPAEQSTVRLVIQTEGGSTPRTALDQAVADLSAMLDRIREAEVLESKEVVEPIEEVPSSVIDLRKMDEVPEPPDLLSVQRASFQRLLAREDGLLGAMLDEIFPITEEGASLTCTGWQIGEPVRDVRTCIQSGRDYTAPVYLALRLTDPASGRVKEDMLAFDLPIMTDQATFVIRGSERVIVNQLIQQDGDSNDLAVLRWRGPGELIAAVLREGLGRVSKAVREHLHAAARNGVGLREIFNLNPLQSALHAFFYSSPLSQSLDLTNPLSALTHSRRLTAMGPDGVSREEVGEESPVRMIHPSYYGRVCPVETPEGPNIGLISSPAVYARGDEDGMIRTPYRKMVDGIVTEEIVYLSPEEEQNAVIAQATPTDGEGRLIGDRIPVRAKGLPDSVSSEQVEYMDVSPHQMLSTSASLIPLMNHDDANRALMGANMQRQAMPLIRPEPPLVKTGLETKVGRDSRRGVTAVADGTVHSVQADRIVVAQDDGTHQIYDLNTFAWPGDSRICSRQRPRVDKGQRVKAGDVLADGPGMWNGELALGRNVRTAFLCYEGYNFEDALVISEKLVADDTFTCVVRERFTVEVKEDETTVPDPHLPHLDEQGVAKIGTILWPGAILVHKRSSEGADTSLRAPRFRCATRTAVVVGTQTFTTHLPPGVKQVIRIEVAAKMPLEVGDKMSLRHGNKGVVARVLPEEDMPFLADDTPVELLLNPVGYVSRMTFGSILEAHLGWAARKLNAQILSPPFNGATPADIEALLEQAGLPRSGMTTLYDGRTGKPFNQEVLVGYLYVLKLSHLVSDKIHARSTGPYSAVTQQPLGGAAHLGGQRFGTMEIWSLETYGAASTLQEMLTLKSDDVEGRTRLFEALTEGRDDVEPTMPESAKTLLTLLRGAGLDVELRSRIA